MYYDYWGLKKPAFDNVPDPSMYVDCHASMENAIAEALFAIEEGNECIAVIVGDVGLGKTLSLRMIIDLLDQEKYRMALITNPGISFGQILQEIIGQLTGEQCKEKRKVNLLEIFNRLLFSTLEEGRKILIFIDEANAMTPMNLEDLRLLTNMQGDGKNLFTMVLAGQIEFARRLEHPKRANLFQRVGTYSRIDKLESMEKVRQYVETRLRLAGATKRIFADDAFESLWEHSGHGIPRLVNKLSKLCLKAGETNQYECITGEMVEQIGSRFQKLTGVAVEKRRARKSVPEDVQPEALEASAGDRALPANGVEVGMSGPESEPTAFTKEVQPEAVEASAGDRALPANGVEVGMSGPESGPTAFAKEVQPEAVEASAGDRALPANGVEVGISGPESGPTAFAKEVQPEAVEASAEDQALPANGVEVGMSGPESGPTAFAKEVQPEAVEASAEDQALLANEVETGISGPESGPTAFILREPSPMEEEDQKEPLPDEAVRPPIYLVPPVVPKPEEPQPQHAAMDSEAEMCIGQVKIKIHFPTQLMKQSCSSSQEHRFKLAGGLAAETLKKYPDLMASPSADPVPIWLEIRDFVLDRMTQAGRM